MFLEVPGDAGYDGCVSEAVKRDVVRRAEAAYDSTHGETPREDLYPRRLGD